MGASASVDLRPEEVAELQDITAYEPKEIKALYKRFRRLDRSGRGTLSNDDLQMIPEIAMNPLSSRLQVLFDKDGEERINFKSFVSALAIFAERARPDMRTRAVFRLYDIDGDGVISRDDLRQLLALTVGKSLLPSALDDIIGRTISAADTDGDGRISYEDFEQSTLALSWEQFTVPIKASSRWEVQEALQANSSLKVGGGE